MRLLELQRRLRLNRVPRFICLAVSAAAFYAALVLVILTGIPGSGGAPAAAPSPEPEPEQPVQTAAGGNPEPRYLPDDAEMKLLARAVYSEARGEEHRGQVAVAAVILNRIDHPDFPGDVAGVIFQPRAFTAVADGQFWLEPDRQAYRAVEEALAGSDPSSGAIYYYNPVTATCRWIFTRQTVTRIGRHLFAV